MLADEVFRVGDVCRFGDRTGVVEDIGLRSTSIRTDEPGPVQIVECVAGPTGLLQTARPGQIIVDMSTVDPGTTQRMATLAREKGVGYVDAPVLGRPARVGKWALPVGGRPEDLERCRPILEVIAAKVMHIGESGSGNKIKLLNQMMFSAINAMTA